MFSEYVFEINILLQIPHPRLGPALQLTVGTINFLQNGSDVWERIN